MAQKLPQGLTRGRRVEIVTKSGNNASGFFVRDKDDIVYLRSNYDGEEIVAHVEVEAIDVIVIGPKENKDDDAEG